MPEPQVLRVEQGEKVMLSPDSERFRESYELLQPSTATELRNLLGPSPETARALHKRGVRPPQATEQSRPVAPEDLDSEDEVVRGHAENYVGNALSDYVYVLDPVVLEEATEPAVFEKYLAARPLKVAVAVLPDIEVADGGLLLVSEDTQVLKANKITIRGTGRMECSGATKIEANEIVGV